MGGGNNKHQKEPKSPKKPAGKATAKLNAAEARARALEDFSAENVRNMSSTSEPDDEFQNTSQFIARVGFRKITMKYGVDFYVMDRNFFTDEFFKELPPSEPFEMVVILKYNNMHFFPVHICREASGEAIKMFVAESTNPLHQTEELASQIGDTLQQSNKKLAGIQLHHFPYEYYDKDKRYNLFQLQKSSFGCELFALSLAANMVKLHREKRLYTQPRKAMEHSQYVLDDMPTNYDDGTSLNTLFEFHELTKIDPHLLKLSQSSSLVDAFAENFTDRVGKSKENRKPVAIAEYRGSHKEQVGDQRRNHAHYYKANRYSEKHLATIYEHLSPSEIAEIDKFVNSIHMHTPDQISKTVDLCGAIRTPPPLPSAAGPSSPKGIPKPNSPR